MIYDVISIKSAPYISVMKVLYTLKSCTVTQYFVTVNKVEFVILLYPLTEYYFYQWQL
jgi:hypothetical protein